MYTCIKVNKFSLPLPKKLFNIQESGKNILIHMKKTDFASSLLKFGKIYIHEGGQNYIYLKNGNDKYQLAFLFFLPIFEQFSL